MRVTTSRRFGTFGCGWNFSRSMPFGMISVRAFGLLALMSDSMAALGQMMRSAS